MFVDAPIEGVVLRPTVCHRDSRGWLVEFFRQDEIPAEISPQMAYVSETLPGMARGPHAHREQTDYFVFVGPGNLTLYLWDMRDSSTTRGHRQKLVVGELNPVVAIIPPGVVHGYRNAGDRPAWNFNLPNRLYAGEKRRSFVDEIRFEDSSGHPFIMD